MPIQYRSDALRRSLQTLHHQAPAVRGSAVITQDGLVIAAFPPGWDENIHDPTGGDHVAALAAVVAGQAEKTLARLNQGQMERVLMEGEHGTIAVLPITHDAALAVLILKDAKLGLTLHAARRAADEIQSVLDKTK
ncbi:MAG: roadblock/LC7 domain-containing protein [Anaerolineales bacterium]|nr:roadblock/LC7 domain-containing protein [Anaerolineales bacterium]